MNQLQEAGFRAQRTQSFDDAKTQAATAMHRSAGGFIQQQQVIVFIQNAMGQRGHFIQFGRDRRVFTLSNTHWRHTHHITGRQLVFRLDASFINSHLTLAHDAINHALRHAF
ncbi:hypothetical protein D3C78_1533610 [compost metagenome]